MAAVRVGKSPNTSPLFAGVLIPFRVGGWVGEGGGLQKGCPVGRRGWGEAGKGMYSDWTPNG